MVSPIWRESHLAAVEIVRTRPKTWWLSARDRLRLEPPPGHTGHGQGT
jgi:hypothetical protein